MNNRFSKYWLPLLLWMALIFGASTGAGAPNVSSYFLRPLLYWIDPNLSAKNFELIHLCVRKMAHLTEYAGLGFLALRIARTEPCLTRMGLIWQVGLALLFAAGFASTDEFHQSFVPGRHPAITDVMIDTTGSAVGVALALGFERMRRAK